MTYRKRNIRVPLYLDEQENFILREKMKLAKKKSIGDFLRQLILYGFTYDVDYTPIREMNIELGRISRNINQIAKRANATNTVYKEDLRIIQEQLEKIWHIQKSILSNQPSIKQ